MRLRGSRPFWSRRFEALVLLVRLHHNLHPRQGVEGGLAQLARAPALQAGGQRFESVILHTKVWECVMDERKRVNHSKFSTIREDIDILEAKL